jgi:hypothetical protein
MANGTAQDLELAERVLESVPQCQETHEGDPHCGNFLWMWQDQVVEDLNAVQFNLEHLIPMMIRQRERLSFHVQERVLATIRLGLDEIRRLDGVRRVGLAHSRVAGGPAGTRGPGEREPGDARMRRRGGLTVCLPGARALGGGVPWIEACPAAAHRARGTVEVESMGTGMMVWDSAEVSVEAVGLQGTPRVTYTKSRA